MQRKPKIYTCFDTSDDVFEPLGDNPEVVERVGYRNTQQQIAELMMSGAMLEQFRAEAYDYQSDKDDDGITMPPTRNPNFDMADATQLLNATNERIALYKNNTKDTSEKTVETSKNVENLQNTAEKTVENR